MEFEVNGVPRKVETDPERLLLHVLREDLELTGTKYGCGEGQCGACTVLLDGQPIRSCMQKVKGADGKKVITIEGVAANGKLHPLQEAFLEIGAMQCGYCTPGMVLSALALIQKQTEPSDDDIVQALQGNICRCGTYGRIIAAVKHAAKRMKK
jgi:aerobic-type carbon monoxide dehydrogenase small subunit (CoxS/CutS family)